jgi:chemotaxis protein MotB
MSSEKDASVPHEIVIVKRRAGFEDESHHGGAWKIAFADLMTAMMTFFLVMWLLSVSDKKTITQIAAYFNPTTFSDDKKSEKGIFDVSEDQEQEEGKKAAKEIKAKEDPESEAKDKAEKAAGDGQEAKGDPKKAEEELFNDPYGVLARIAMKAMLAGEKENGGTLEGAESLPGGEAYRSPFDPAPMVRPLDGMPALTPAPNPQPTAGGVGEPGDRGATITPSAPPEAAPTPASREEAEKMDAAAAQALEKEIMEQLKVLAPEDMPNIEVKHEPEGVLISLTDDFRFGMFDVGSAVPKPEVVVVMEKVAKALGEREGKIVVRGHTDGRPFKSGKNDNWRLSMDRAQMAYYMLVRGGLAEGRVERIEGHADRKLKIADDPNAAQNRRIEILLRTAAP